MESSTSSSLLVAGSSFIISIILSIQAAGPRIKDLFIYPVKSCQGIRLEKAEITCTGLKHDREFMLIDKNDKFVSQRTMPKMALIRTRIDEKRNMLHLEAPGVEPFEVSLDRSSSDGSDIVDTNVWGDDCKGVVVKNGGPWFARFLGVEENELRLLRFAADFKRPTDPDYAPDGQSAFSDGYPFLLASVESLEDLNMHLAKQVSMKNFRPNIVLKGCAKPWVEDLWRSITILTSVGPVEMMAVKPCARCKVPTVDPSTGEFDPDNEPSRTMRKIRSGAVAGFKKEKWQGEVFFGQNLVASVSTGYLTVGDTVRIGGTIQQF